MGAGGHGEELTRALGLVEEEVEERDDFPAHVQQLPMFNFMRKRKIHPDVTLDEMRRAQTLLRAAICAKWDPPAHEATVRLVFIVANRATLGSEPALDLDLLRPPAILEGPLVVAFVGRCRSLE